MPRWPKKEKRWTLEKVRKKGITKYTDDPSNPLRKVINPEWKRLAIAYSPECAEEVIHRIRGGEPITRICKTKGIPTFQTICNWMKKFPDFADEIRRAKEDAQLLIHDRMDGDFAEMHKDIEDSDHKIANAKATLYREQVGWRKWSMERMNPKVFSPKMQIDQNVNIRQVSFIIETSKDKDIIPLSAENKPSVIDVTPIKTVDIGGKLKKEADEVEEEYATE